MPLSPTPPLDPTAAGAIQSAAKPDELPDGTAVRTIDAAALERIARKLGRPGREVEAAALALDVLPLRYSRNYRSLSFADQARLLESAVAVVGLGGLGGAVAETLGRLGVGTLTLIDGDRFEESNLNRQLLSTRETLGAPKAETAARRLREVNPSVSTEVRGDFLSRENAERLLSGCGLAVDCLDAIPTRFVLEEAAKRLGIPLVSAAIAGRSGHVTTVFPEDTGLRAVYGDPDAADAKGVETRLGNLPFTVSVVANLQCAEAERLLLSRPPLFRNALLLVDLETGAFERMMLERSP